MAQRNCKGTDDVISHVDAHHLTTYGNSLAHLLLLVAGGFQVRCRRDGVSDQIPDRGAHRQPVCSPHDDTVHRSNRSSDSPDSGAVDVANGAAIGVSFRRAYTAPHTLADSPANWLADGVSHGKHAVGISNLCPVRTTHGRANA